MNSIENQTSVQKKIIEKYKELVKQDNNEDEVYKWEMVKEFQSKWDIDVEDFPAMIKSINFSNLMFHHSKKFIDISDNYSEDIRGMFKDLFNENKDLRERILGFQTRANELFAEHEPELKAQQDERAISTYLTFRYPEKYTFYKSSFYNKYTKLLGLKSHKTNEKFIHYLSLIDSLIEDYITKDEELLSISKSYLSSNCYDDSNYKILAQNILYRVFDNSDFIEEPNDSDHSSLTKAQVIHAFLFSGLSHRKIQSDILKEDAPARGGGFLTMKILHNYDIREDKKGVLKTNSLSNEKEVADGKYLEALKLLEKHYPELMYDKPNNGGKMNLSLNTIIYGPPGTGKTYRLKNEFFEKFTDKQAIQTKEEFCDELIQDLSWWQVISIVMLDLKEAKVQEIFDHPLLQAKVSVSENKSPKNTIWAWLQRHTKDDCPNVNFKKRDNPQFFSKDNKSTWTIDEEIAKIEIPDFYEILEKYQNFKPQTESKKRYVFTTFHQSFSYEDFIEGIKPKLMKNEEDLESQDISYHIENGIFKNIVNKAINDPDKDYAIFIDEINRGNIANIFGELITLIEEDKRKGCDNYIPAILPYSKTEFWVPKNLYIIGTMNTADRSVEALDNALRRRFSFLEMNPEPAKLSQEEFACEGVNLEKLLSAINNRIEKLLDKDYCIGHSYFMNIRDQKNPLEELKMIFSNRILPLLQEYFYGDWGKIMLVLGKGFIGKKVESVSFLATEDCQP
ncbi:AAA family ATPase [Desulfobacula sp.]|uniref:McrB family protein n=1 Tax=Desulfobacula sp. TaxID=2593537 RepID=UPI002608CCB1|nr:AAA family ATPase [Desulfobacula sp.]